MSDECKVLPYICLGCCRAPKGKLDGNFFLHKLACSWEKLLFCLKVHHCMLPCLDRHAFASLPFSQTGIILHWHVTGCSHQEGIGYNWWVAMFELLSEGIHNETIVHIAETSYRMTAMVWFSQAKALQSSWGTDICWHPGWHLSTSHPVEPYSHH